MNRASLLFAAAAVLLAIGAAGPLMRYLNPPDDPAAQQAARLDAEHASLRAELAQDRARVVAEMQERLAAGDAQGVLARGARFHVLKDREINDLYAKAAEQQSFQRRVEEVRALIMTQCEPAAAGEGARHFLQEFAGAGAGVSLETLKLSRLPDAQARPAIVALVAKPSSGVAAGDDVLARAHAEHRARLHAYDAVALQLEPLPEGIVCAWRLEGPVRVQERERAIALDFWLAPNVAANRLDFEAFAYTVR